MESLPALKLFLLADRFWSKVDRTGGPDACWPWLAGKFWFGHGAFQYEGKTLRAHRVAYYLANGVWPEPMGLHSCDTPACCNPAHIRPGTQRENVDDAVSRGRWGGWQHG